MTMTRTCPNGSKEETKARLNQKGVDDAQKFGEEKNRQKN